MCTASNVTVALSQETVMRLKLVGWANGKKLDDYLAELILLGYQYKHKQELEKCIH